jgi:hypothetical protein
MFTFVMWQLIIVSAALTLPLGITTGKEYAELEWPIDLLIAVVWLGFFGTNFFPFSSGPSGHPSSQQQSTQETEALQRTNTSSQQTPRNSATLCFSFSRH